MTKFGKFLISKKSVPLFFFLLIAANVFVYWEFRAFFHAYLDVTLNGWLLAGMFGVLVLYLLMENQKYTSLKKAFSIFFGYYISLFLYLFLCLLASELLSALFALAFPELPWDKVCFMIGISAACMIFLYGIGNVHRVKTVQYSMDSDHSTGKKYRIVLLSDLHIGGLIGVRHLSRIVKATNACQPDLIVIAGDIFNGRSVAECTEYDEAAILLRRLQSKDGVIAVPGNHDSLPNDVPFQHFLKQAHITLLDDQCAEYRDLMIVGRKDIVRQDESGRLSLSQLVKTKEKDSFYIIVDHNPRGVEEAADWGANLVLSGHTHKGQLFPMDLLTKAAYGRKRFWGKHKIKSTWLIVSAGAGYFQLPLRVGSKNEVVCLEL